MTRCLDEATLQSYFDGELSAQLMERASSHLAGCVTCAAAAREIAEETALLTSALEAEFEVSVPTQAVRERIDAAVLGVRVANVERTEKAGFFAAFANVFSFNSQRNLGYASLVVVLAFGAILGIVKYRQAKVTPQTTNHTDNIQAAAPSDLNKSKTVEVADNRNQSVVPDRRPVVPQQVKYSPRPATSKVVPVKNDTLRLLPGERSYLQAIARLDTTINSNKKAMRPSLQVEYERNLAVVDRAIAATRNAAKSNPNDPDAADFMFAAYQSKVDLLNTIADARLSGGRSH
ncbi:MAG TPA: zf-HC2 domain-containing protein [Pyrinomonadaceae bacterium]|nr:zf-HC2 domain-containing protein [Pyrinomonadaceae bacterium]